MLKVLFCIYTMGMIKKLLFLLLTALLTFPTYAAPLRTLVTKRARQAQSAAAQITDTSSSRQAEIIQALFQEVNRPTRSLTWEQFEQETVQHQQNSQAVIAEQQQKVCHLFDTDCQLYHKIVLPIPLYGTVRPDYAKETSQAKYIYVTDASAHDTKTIPQEVGRVLSSVRQTHPQARILLATEFAIAQDTAEAPIHFAGPQNVPFFISEEYRSLVPLANSLDIDILGLDDSIIVQDQTHNNAIKVGDALVDFDPFSLSQHIQEILVQYDGDWGPTLAGLPKTITEYHQLRLELRYVEEHPDHIAKDNNWSAQQTQTYIAKFKKTIEEYHTYLQGVADIINIYITDFLHRSNWGVYQRNIQWTRYIKAVSKYYDIIIVYGGSGHLDDTLFGAVPEQIKEPYVLFNLYTEEKISENLQNAYQNVDEIRQEKFGDFYSTDDLFQREDIQIYNQEFIDKFDNVFALNGKSLVRLTPPPGADPHSHVFFIKHKTNSHLSAEEKAEYSVTSRTRFDVYLPDESSANP